MPLPSPVELKAKLLENVAVSRIFNVHRETIVSQIKMKKELEIHRGK